MENTNMDSLRKPGTLIFEGPNTKQRLQVLWTLRFGEIAEAQSWIAAISFSSNYSIPEETQLLIFEALRDPSIKIKFQFGDDVMTNCVINDIEDLECGVIKIGSPDLGSEKITIRRQP